MRNFTPNVLMRLSSLQSQLVETTGPKRYLPTTTRQKCGYFLGTVHAIGIPTSRRWLTAVSSSTSSSSADQSPAPIPRAAVSTVVQCTVVDGESASRCNNSHNSNHKNDDDDGGEDDKYGRRSTTPTYLLIQRGKPPNVGMWSFPGGKLEYGESTLEGAKRELAEETIWQETDWKNLQWYEEAPMGTSDSIGDGFHYLIAQCFARIVVPETLSTTSPPFLTPADDAADAAWFTLSEIEQLQQIGQVTPGVIRVIERAEQLDAAGLLPTTRPIF